MEYLDLLIKYQPFLASLFFFVAGLNVGFLSLRERHLVQQIDSLNLLLIDRRNNSSQPLLSEIHDKRANLYAIRTLRKVKNRWWIYGLLFIYFSLLFFARQLGIKNSTPLLSNLIFPLRSVFFNNLCKLQEGNFCQLHSGKIFFSVIFILAAMFLLSFYNFFKSFIFKNICYKSYLATQNGDKLVIKNIDYGESLVDEKDYRKIFSENDLYYDCCIVVCLFIAGFFLFGVFMTSDSFLWSALSFAGMFLIGILSISCFLLLFDVDYYQSNYH